MGISVAELRALCGAKSFAIERTPGKRWKLVDLELGHAVRHPVHRIPSWSLREAVIYLRHLERDPDANEP